MIDLLLLGNGSMQPLPDRWLSSLVIRIGSELTLFDCGEGTQIVHRLYGWGFERISSICLSHHHADHVAGLSGILMCIANAGRRDPVTIYGPRGTVAIVDGLLVICPPFPFELRITELNDDDTFTLPNKLRCRVIELEQRSLLVLAWRFELSRRPKFDRARAEAAGIRLDLWSNLQRGEAIEFEGRVFEPGAFLGPPRRGVSLGIVTDTRPGQRLAEFMNGVDLLVSEATYLDDADLNKALLVDHFVLSEACALAQMAGARRLLLTHFSASYPDPHAYEPIARSQFPNAEIGYSGWQTVLSMPDE